MPDITISRRFCGPPRSANGGYAAGRLAAYLEGPAEVTLVAPPPLDRPLAVLCGEDGSVELRSDASRLAVARPAPAPPVEFPVPSAAEADAAATRSLPRDRHQLPGCFVCGPDRAPGDGLRLHVGPLDPGDDEWEGVLAACWRPAADLAGADGQVLPEFLWAALDCPTAYACGSPAGMPPILLGRQAVAVFARPQAGTDVIVLARRTGREGRKHFADAALYDPDGTPLAVCRTTWIEVSPEVLRGIG